MRQIRRNVALIFFAAGLRSQRRHISCAEVLVLFGSGGAFLVESRVFSGYQHTGLLVVVAICHSSWVSVGGVLVGCAGKDYRDGAVVPIQ